MRRIASTSEQLARLLRGRRHELGLTQRALAERSGLLQKTISAVENDPDSRSVATVYRLLRALDLELSVAPKPDAPDPAEHLW